jgi:hypothetical protein
VSAGRELASTDLLAAPQGSRMPSYPDPNELTRGMTVEIE